MTTKLKPCALLDLCPKGKLSGEELAASWPAVPGVTDDFFQHGHSSR